MPIRYHEALRHVTEGLVVWVSWLPRLEYPGGMTLHVVFWLIAAIVAGVGAFLRAHPWQGTLIAASLCFGFLGFVLSGAGL